MPITINYDSGEKSKAYNETPGEAALERDLSKPCKLPDKFLEPEESRRVVVQMPPPNAFINADGNLTLPVGLASILQQYQRVTSKEVEVALLLPLAFYSLGKDAPRARYRLGKGIDINVDRFLTSVLAEKFRELMDDLLNIEKIHWEAQLKEYESTNSDIADKLRLLEDDIIIKNKFDTYVVLYGLDLLASVSPEAEKKVKQLLSFLTDHVAPSLLDDIKFLFGKDLNLDPAVLTAKIIKNPTEGSHAAGKPDGAIGQSIIITVVIPGNCGA